MNGENVDEGSEGTHTRREEEANIAKVLPNEGTARTEYSITHNINRWRSRLAIT
jgi:hypothetical protein